MRGADRAAGAVAAMRGIRNPVLAARAVLDEGRHVMLVGESAGAFAREAGLDTAPEAWFRTEERRRAFERRRAAGPSAPSPATRAAASRRRPRPAARAASTPAASATRRSSRAGTWADDATAAISCTGDGEAIIRVALAHEIDALMRHAGLPLERGVRARARRARARSAPPG